jgi:hypothetical protein
MRLMLRKIAVFLIATGLMFSGATSHGYGATDGAAAMHESHQIQNYADLAIEPGESDCPHLVASATDNVPASQNDGLCKRCCAACMSVSLMPDAPAPLSVMSLPFSVYAAAHTTLVAHNVPTDPGIPKSL